MILLDYIRYCVYKSSALAMQKQKACPGPCPPDSAGSPPVGVLGGEGRAERAAAGRNLPKPAETGGKIKTKRRGTRAGAPSLLIQCRIQKLTKLFTSPQKGLVKTRQKLPRCEPRPPQSTNLNRFRPTSGEYSRSTWPSMRCRMNSPVRLTMARFTWPPRQMPCITLATTMCRCR